jgi:hypothetical protein
VAYALAYRATVDAVYAKAAGTIRGGDQPTEAAESCGDSASMARKYPADYVRSGHEAPEVHRPHESPANWIREVNHDEDLPGRRNNCGECARAVCSTWYGRPATAAAMADPDAGGEPSRRMTEWAGHRPEPATMAEIGCRLTELGPGSSAIVGCDWWTGGGHWFNAVNDAGDVKAVDGQFGRVEDWPPSPRGVGFDESIMRISDVVFFYPDGRAVRD